MSTSVSTSTSSGMWPAASLVPRAVGMPFERKMLFAKSFSVATALVSTPLKV